MEIDEKEKENDKELEKEKIKEEKEKLPESKVEPLLDPWIPMEDKELKSIDEEI